MSEYGGTFISNTGAGYDCYRIVGGKKHGGKMMFADGGENSTHSSGGYTGGSAYSDNFLISIITMHNKNSAEIGKKNKKTMMISDDVLQDYSIPRKSKESFSLQTILFGGKKKNKKDATHNTGDNDDAVAEVDPEQSEKQKRKEKIKEYYKKISGRGASMANMLMTTSQYEADTLDMN